MSEESNIVMHPRFVEGSNRITGREVEREADDLNAVYVADTIDDVIAAEPPPEFDAVCRSFKERSDRLLRLIELNAPSVFVNNEIGMINQSLTQLMEHHIWRMKDKELGIERPQETKE